jgi:hypothetical protein
VVGYIRIISKLHKNMSTEGKSEAHKAYQAQEAAAAKNDLEIYDARRAAAEKHEQLKQDLVDGKVEVDEEVKKAVDEALDQYWGKLDEYVAALREDEDADVKAPSRNEHRVKAFKALPAEGEGSDHFAPYWEIAFDKQMEERGIGGLSGDEMGNLLYDGIVPDSYKAPKKEQE